MAAPGLIDTRVLGKPDRLYGKESEYEEWKESFESWAGLLNDSIGEFLRAAAKEVDPIVYAGLKPEMKVMTKLIYHVLVNLCKKRASVICAGCPTRTVSRRTVA